MLHQIVSDCQPDKVLTNLDVKLSRTNITTKIDLHNVEAAFEVKTGGKNVCPFRHDDSHIESFIKRHGPSILFSKLQVQTSEGYPLLGDCLHDQLTRDVIVEIRSQSDMY